jgi:hypothetical protein
LTDAYYFIDATHLLLQSLDTPDNSGHSLANGEVIAQTGAFSAGSLSGNAVFSMTGVDLSTSHNFTVTAAGQVNGDGLGGSSVKLDEVSNGSVVFTGTNTIPSGSFSASANGMGVLTFGTTRAFSVAMYGQNAGFIMEGTQASPPSPGNVLVGDMQPQTAPPSPGFVDGTFSGLYAIGADRPASTNSGVDVGSVTATTSTNPASFSGKTDHSSGAGCSTSCLTADQTVSATYAVDGNGRVVITLSPASGGGTAVGWLNDNKNAVALSDTSGSNGKILKLNQ